MTSESTSSHPERKINTRQNLQAKAKDESSNSKVPSSQHKPNCGRAGRALQLTAGGVALTAHLTAQAQGSGFRGWRGGGRGGGDVGGVFGAVSGGDGTSSSSGKPSGGGSSKIKELESKNEALATELAELKAMMQGLIDSQK